MSIITHTKFKEARRLNIGCGNAPMEGFLNVDIGNCEKDMYLDITKPIPFPDECFTEIVANHVLEHIPQDSFFSVFREIHRVMRKGATLSFAVPHAGSDNYWTDPTHTMPFTQRTMDFLIKGTQVRENGIIYGADYEFSSCEPPQMDQVYTIYFKITK